MSGLAIWFVGIFVVAICASLVAVVLMKRSTRTSEGGVEAAPQKMAFWLARLGLVFSSIALIIAICLVPIANYLPEDISLPAFIYSLLAFPVFVALGVVLSLLGYVFKHYRSGLAGMIIGGLSVVWLVASYFVRMSTFD